MRLIDADALESVYDDKYSLGEIGRRERDDVVDALRYCATTVDVMPVVRCEKCKHWDRDWEPNHSDGNQHFCPMIGLVTTADFFCKDGERKGGGE